jgi:hypothetical protein
VTWPPTTHGHVRDAIEAMGGPAHVNATSSSTTYQLQSAINHTILLNSPAVLITLPAPKPGASFFLLLAQGGVGGRKATWATDVYWAAGMAPVLSTATDRQDLLRFVCLDGVAWIGTVVAQQIRPDPLAGIEVDPGDISGLYGWYDATEVTGVSDGTTINSVVDRSTQANHLGNVTSYAGPTWQAAGLNGKPTFRFNGAQGIGKTSLVGTGVNSFTFMLVMNPDYITGSNPQMGGATDTNATATFNIQDGKFNFDRCNQQAVGSSTAMAPIQAGTAFIAGFAYDGGAASGTWVANGVRQAFNAALNGSLILTNQAFGCKRDGFSGNSKGFTGTISEVCWWNRRLTATELDHVEDYLTARWL